MKLEIPIHRRGLAPLSGDLLPRQAEVFASAKEALRDGGPHWLVIAIGVGHFESSFHQLAFVCKSHDFPSQIGRSRSALSKTSTESPPSASPTHRNPGRGIRREPRSEACRSSG